MNKFEFESVFQKKKLNFTVPQFQMYLSLLSNLNIIMLVDKTYCMSIVATFKDTLTNCYQPTDTTYV